MNIKTRNFSRKSGGKDSSFTLTREGNVVKVFRDGGKSFDLHSKHEFPTVTAAKAFFNYPIL